MIVDRPGTIVHLEEAGVEIVIFPHGQGEVDHAITEEVDPGTIYPGDEVDQEILGRGEAGLARMRGQDENLRGDVDHLRPVRNEFRPSLISNIYFEANWNVGFCINRSNQLGNIKIYDSLMVAGAFLNVGVP